MQRFLSLSLLFITSILNIVMWLRIRNAIFYLLQAIALFIFLNNFNLEVNAQKLKNIRNVSTCIYLLHQIVLALIWCFTKENAIIVYIIVCILCIGIELLVKKVNCKLLNEVLLIC